MKKRLPITKALIITSAIILAFMATVITALAATSKLKLEEVLGRLEITEAGEYTLTGKLDGSVYVDPGEGDVTLILDGVDIESVENAGIIAVSGDSLTIRLPEGSVNRISDTTADATYKAAIYSAVDLFFEGDGALYVNSTNENGIRTDNADLQFDGGQYAITAAINALTADGKNAGSITINAGHFSVQAENSIDPEANVVVNNGVFEKVTQTAAQSSNSGYSEQPVVSDSSAQNNVSDQGNDIQSTDNSVMEGQAPQDGQMPQIPDGQMPQMQDGQMPQMPDGQMPQEQTITGTTDTATEIVTGTETNSAADLEADYENATYISVTDENSQIKITSSGTHIISGTASDGNIVVKKGTTGVVLILQDLDLTSTTGATVSVNKEAEVKIIISGNVVLTDNENPEDEYSEDADVADAYDGAALKAKANSTVYVTGDGTLTINGNAKNGIKAGDDSSLIFDGVTVNITAVNDGINGNYDVTLLSGNFTIAAGDDAIHADHILTVGSSDGTGPVIHVTESTEGLEGTVINVYGGDISIVSSDDSVNAANGDALYEDELDYSFNMMGGTLVINSQGDGIDSNGNVNLIGGSAQISSAAGGGEAGIDYDGELYVSDDFELNNRNGVSGADNMGGMPGEAPFMNGNNNGFPFAGR